MTNELKILACALLTSRPQVFEEFHRDLGETFEITWIRDGLDLDEELQKDALDIIVCDPHLGHINVEHLVRSCQLLHPRAPLFFISDPADKEFSRWAFQKGITNLIELPLHKDDVIFKVELALRVKSKMEEGGLSEQEIGHVYNLLKAYYYDLENILVYIKNSNLSLSVVQAELDKKSRFGSCIFDHVPRFQEKDRAS